MKKALAALLVFVLCMLPTVGGQTVQAYSYEDSNAGDIVYFGSYPQSLVEDSVLIGNLDKVSKTWISYPYYAHNPSCLMDRGGYNGSSSSYRVAVSVKDTGIMRFSDFSYGGKKYRAVEILKPLYQDIAGTKVNDEWVLSDGFQAPNGFVRNKIYYFEYEPLRWIILDRESGLLLCESVIDTQPFNATYNINVSSSRPVWKSAINDQYTADNYGFSTIRHWLNGFTTFDTAYSSFNFVNTAFNQNERDELITNSYKIDLRGGSYITVNDRVFLLNETDIRNYASLLTRAKSTDYAQSQGIQALAEGNGSPWYSSTSFELTDPADQFRLKTVFSQSLSTGNYGSLTSTKTGIRPAIKVDLNAPEVRSIRLSAGTNDAGKPVLSWTSVSGATSYAIYRALEGIDPKKESAWDTYPIANVSSATTTYTDTLAPAEKTHYYRIVATVSGGEIVSDHAQAVCTLPAPNIYKVGQNLTTGNTTFTWKFEGTASGFAIMRKLDDDSSSWRQIGSVDGDGYTYTDLYTSAGNSYCYKIMAMSGKGSTYNSGYSNTQTIRGILPKPSEVKVEPNEAGVPVVSWKRDYNACAYRLMYKATDETQWKEIYLSWDTMNQYYTDRGEIELVGAVYGKKYEYRLQAIWAIDSEISYDSGWTSGTAECAQSLKITKQPANVRVAVGDTAQFTVVATGAGTLSYQWQSRKDDKSSWANSGQPGAKTATLKVATTAGLHGWQFRCIVSDKNGRTATSVAAVLKLYPKITTQPQNTRVQVGDTAKFTIVATGKAPLSYQWQSRKDASSAWSNSGQPGAKTATLNVTATAGLNGWQFRCVVTDGNGQSWGSGPATLRVAPKFTTQPKSTYAAPGTETTFTVAATGKATLKYQWQSRKNASAEWANSGLPGAKTATLKVTATAGLNGWQFRCVVTDGNGETWGSAAATLFTKLGILKQPANATASAGSTAKFTVEAYGKAPLKYQWQSRKNSSSEWSNSGQPGAKTATLQVSTTAGLNGWQFRCIVTDGAGNTLPSAGATLTVK
ncbi:MAG: immunoglobulin domain-containing protein [Lachnospiraceae bacterium]|nr:immunoglobulin domain-containing protein [Lachnospiraceae bacterium]